jgi:hypothetical protein
MMTFGALSLVRLLALSCCAVAQLKILTGHPVIANTDVKPAICIHSTM